MQRHYQELLLANKIRRSIDLFKVQSALPLLITKGRCHLVPGIHHGIELNTPQMIKTGDMLAGGTHLEGQLMRFTERTRDKTP